jgi:hypothetical protein
VVTFLFLPAGLCAFRLTSVPHAGDRKQPGKQKPLPAPAGRGFRSGEQRKQRDFFGSRWTIGP